jgi:hypothetical protein
MLKAIILGCAICIGTSGTVVLVKTGGNADAHSPGSGAALSIQEMHSLAHLDGLPVQTFQAY